MTEYFNAMDRGDSSPMYISGKSSDNTGRDNYGMSDKEPEIGINMIGKSVIAGHGQGGFRNVLQGAIKQGAGSVEMALTQEGGEPGVSAEDYGKIARRELREIALASGVEINSVHVPPEQIGNLSGRTQDSFNEVARNMSIQEIRKAIDFAADVGNGGSVVVHTGEFDRSIKDNYSEGKYKFESFPGEEKFGTVSWVDAKTGRIQQISRNQEFQYVERNEQGHVELDDDGNINPEKIHRYTYNELQELYKTDPKKFENQFNHYENIFKDKKEEAKALNFSNGEKKEGENPALKAAFGLFMSQQLADAEFRKKMYLSQYLRGKNNIEKVETAIKFYEALSPEERERRSVIEGANMHLIPPDVTDPVEYLKDKKRELINGMKTAEDYSVSGTIAEKQILEQARNFKTPEQYALEKSTKSLAELGIYTMQKSNNEEFKKFQKRDLYVAPENIFPEMGYGSHPQELINLVEKSRAKMVELLTKPKIEEVDFDGNKKMINNPYYKGISEKEAKKEAENHIKATLDFQHLGMWRKNFVRNSEETLEDTENRFQKWYLEQVDELQKKNILGNLHIVDGMGGSGHSHLPAGEGVNPIKTALLKLVGAGYKGVMNSEGYAYNTNYSPNEQLFRTWSSMGSPVYSVAAPGRGGKWSDTQNSYFGYTNISPYSFGSYVPSNDWTLWSQVPLD